MFIFHLHKYDQFLPPMNTVKNTVWIAVADNLEMSEHITMQAALEPCPFVLFLEKEGTWKNGEYDNYAYTVEFYNKEGIKVDGVSINNWRLSDLKIGTRGYVRDTINFSVMDPWGNIESKYFGNARAGIIGALVFLQAASRYYSWSEYRNEDPEEKERSAIRLLEKEVEELKAENERLKAKLEAIHGILTTTPAE